MKKSLFEAAIFGAIALILNITTARAQDEQKSISASDIETLGDLWFVELSGSPTADGNSLTNVRAEKAAFKKAARAAGIKFTERRSFDVLFNGYSMEVDTANRTKLQLLDSVKALWPVDVIQAPKPDPSFGEAPDLATALATTGANSRRAALS